jgi:hypothetical protein
VLQLVAARHGGGGAGGRAGAQSWAGPRGLKTIPRARVDLAGRDHSARGAPKRVATGAGSILQRAGGCSKMRAASGWSRLCVLLGKFPTKGPSRGPEGRCCFLPKAGVGRACVSSPIAHIL